MSSSTISAKPVPGRWTIEHRTDFHLLYTGFNYTDEKANRADVANIFNHLFEADLQMTHPKGLKEFTINDDCVSTDAAGRAKVWKDITATDASDDQKALEARLMPMLRTAIGELGLG